MSEGENACRKFFEQYAQHPKKVEILQEQSNIDDWEKLSASRHSPGPVAVNEGLVRIVFNPIHVDVETGKLKPSAVSDAKDKGCSVNRLTHTTLADSIVQGKAVAAFKNDANPEKAARTVYGVAQLTANDVRSISVHAADRAFAIYDTGLEKNRSHADVCQIVPEKNKQQARSARLQLFDLANRGLLVIN